MVKKINAEEQKFFEQAISELIYNGLLTVEYVEEAVKQGVDFNYYDEHGLNPLHQILMIENNNILEIVKMFVKQGVDVDIEIKEIGVTPLLLSIEDEDVMLFLLEEGANPNVIVKDEFTALMLISEVEAELPEEKKIYAASALIKAGAKVSLKNKKGQTALDIAKEKGETKLVMLFETALEKEIKAEQDLKDKQQQKEQRHQENVKQALGRTTPKPRRRQKFN